MCKLNDEVIYIGQGKVGRSKHCLSGCSHVYELNKLHFNGVAASIDIVLLSSNRERVIEYEKELILKYKPKLNSVYVKDDRNKLQPFIHKFRSEFNMFKTALMVKGANSAKFDMLLKEFTSFYRYSDINDGSIVIYSRHHYIDVNLHHLAQLSRSIRDDTGLYAVDHYCIIFNSIFERVVGYKLSEKLNNIKEK